MFGNAQQTLSVRKQQAASKCQNMSFVGIRNILILKRHLNFDVIFCSNRILTEV